MAKDNVLHLMIVDASSNAAERLASVIRAAGYAVRPTHVEDDEDLAQRLTEHPFDIILLSDQLELCTLAKAVEIVTELGKDIPILVIAEEFGEGRCAELMDSGAIDLVSRSSIDRLKQILHREIDQLHHRRHLRHIEKLAKDTERRCQTLLESSRDAISYIHDGMHIHANPVYLKMFGFHSMEEIEGEPILDMVSPAKQPDFKEFLRSYAKGKQANESIETQVVFPDGSEQHVIMEFSAATIEGELCTQLLIRGQANTQELESKIQYLSKQDLVTGLFNRSYFIEELISVVDNAVSEDGHIGGVFYILFDENKKMRDDLGITASDLVYTDFAKLLMGIVDTKDIAARFGDNSFTVLITDKTLHEIRDCAERICKAVENHVCEIAGRSVILTCSIGISLISENTKDAMEIIKRADLACDVARQEGGNRVHLHNPIADDKADKDRNKHWIEMIKYSLTHDRFHLVFQPIVSISGDPKERYEVLLRMRDYQDDMISPGEFIQIAESAGLIEQIDLWVITATIKNIAARTAKDVPTDFFVKISGPSISNEELPIQIRDLLTQSRLTGENLLFEISESVATKHLKDAKIFGNAVKNLRCGLVLDHFGSGPNSFNLLKHIPADYLKIDGSHIHNLAKSKEKQAFLKSITDLAKSMEKKTIAEFVEDAAGLTMLYQYGVNFIQGYFLQAPTEEMNYDFSEEG